MKLDLSEIISGKKREFSFDYPLTIEDEFYGVTFPEPIKVHGDIVNMAGYITLDVSLTASYGTYCDRCAKPISESISLGIKRTLVPKGSLEEENFDEGEYFEFENDITNSLYLDDMLREEFVLMFPTKHLCHEDCKGLCPKCGKDLNQGDCNCTDEPKSSVWDEVMKKLQE